MEIEYKWELPSRELGEVAAHPLVQPAIADAKRIDMHATYYDTADGLVKRLRGGLRMRAENAESVCCLKLAAQNEGACKTRREFEVAAKSIEDGLAALSATAAPADVVSQLVDSELVVLCETVFTRHAYELNVQAGGETLSAELALDEGFMRREGQQAPIREVELEYKSGSAEAFHAYAQQLERKLGLTVQPLSKLARAMALG